MCVATGTCMLSGEETEGARLTLEGLAALGSVVQGAKQRFHAQPLCDLATLPSEVHAAGYSAVSQWLPSIHPRSLSV